MRSLGDTVFPQGRSRRGGAARRDPGARPQVRRGSSPVPGSLAGALPPAPSLLRPWLRSCRQLQGDSKRLVLSSSLPGRGWSRSSEGLDRDLVAIPEAGEGGRERGGSETRW